MFVIRQMLKQINDQKTIKTQHTFFFFVVFLVKLQYSALKMSKRVADKYLTDQNWDEEDEPEAAGHFRSAEKDVLERRIFKTAKRRINESAKVNINWFYGAGK